MSQEALGKLLGGLSKQVVSRLESGDTSLTTERAILIAKALDTTVEEVLGLGLGKQSGLEEEAIPYDAKPGDPFGRLPSGDNQFLYLIDEPVLDELGIGPDYVALVDISAEATKKIKSGDPVLARARVSETRVVTVARQFIAPNLLITNSRTLNRPPLHVVVDEAPIMGVILSWHRRWSA